MGLEDVLRDFFLVARVVLVALGIMLVLARNQMCLFDQTNESISSPILRRLYGWNHCSTEYLYFVHSKQDRRNEDASIETRLHLTLYQ